MSADPVLILQMQRMGDLVLSFPLVSWLKKHLPEHPVQIIGEEQFFSPLLPLSPTASYFSYECAPDLSQNHFHAVINLSHRPEAALLAGKAKSAHKIGPWRDAQGQLFIGGDWQIYRASITHNNRYNHYHWADLGLLDMTPAAMPFSTVLPLPRPLTQGLARTGKVSPEARAERSNEHVADTGSQSPSSGKRIGLFLGASEPEKHPKAEFWAGLAKLLMRYGHKPVFLGGPAEAPLGAKAAQIAGMPAINLTNHFSIRALADCIGKLDLFITPDTGPMHIATWLGTPVLNLSMGPVNPWETGPISPEHHILRPTVECRGCWQCVQKSPFCREAFTAEKVAAVIRYLFSSGPAEPVPASLVRHLDGLELLVSRRDRYGLYHLESLASSPVRLSAAALPREALAQFWKSWFGFRFGRIPQQDMLQSWTALREGFPDIASTVAESAAKFALLLAKGVRKNPRLFFEDSDFWKSAHAVLHPHSGYVQMFLQNSNASPEALAKALAWCEELAALGRG